MEDLLEKARMKAKEIRKQEKDKIKGGADDHASHAGDDDEYDESEEDNEEDDDEHDEDGESEAEDDGEDEEEAEHEEDNKIEGDKESEEKEGRKTLQAGRSNDENKAEEMVLRHGGSDDDSHQKREHFQTEPSMDDKENHSRPAVDDEGQPVQGKQGQSSPRSPYRRMRRTAYIIPDDDDDEDIRQEKTDDQAKHQSLPEGLDMNEGAPSLDLGIPGQENAELSLSQAFMDTLAEDQPPKVAQSGQESLSLTKKTSDANASTRPADISKPPAIESPVIETAKDQRRNLQAPTDMPNLHLPPAAAVDNDSSAGRSVSKFSVAPTPTQDKGFMYSPYSRRLSIQKAQSAEQNAASETKQPPASSVDTGKKQLLLRRGLKATGTENPMPEVPKGPPIEPSVFDVMKENAKTKKKTQAHFDKQRSEAKDIVDEAAEESDDEYAGLGGRSDDSEGEEDEEDRNMINDDDNAAINEAELAALNAEDLRNKDEAAVQKLYHDITTGALRRKRGHGGENDVDLSDSDDERRAAGRKAKRREFAKMRRALLLADNNIGQIAEDPKKKAFLQTLEEHIMEDSDAGLNVDKEWDGLDDSNDSTESTIVSTSSQQDRSTDTLQRLPLKKKQTVHKPTSSIEVKDAISSLLGEPDTPSAELPDDDDEDEDESVHQRPLENERLSADSESDDELAGPVIGASKYHERPIQHKPTMSAQDMSSQGKFVNRWSLRRTASINAAMSMSTSKPAFNQENRAFISKRNPLLKGPRTLSVTPDSQRATPHAPNSDQSGNAVGAGKASNGGEHANNNYYCASRKRQRESELEHASGTPNKPRKLTAVIAAARTGAGLRKWVGDQGFET
ncbi:hypothetical protein KEM56_003064 [Ascosphaera pollenicola]|nr:hypothetical protein KEM56_003064 [Ascosphaera pollenicola]